MPDKIKIMILQTRHIESISYLTAELVRAFPTDRYQVSLVYLETGEPDAKDSLAHECIFLGLSKTDYKGLRIKAMRKVRPFLQANHFDVIIANMYKPVHLLMQLRQSVTASLCIGIIHAFGEFDRPGRRWMMRFLLDQRWRMVGVSQPVRDYLINARCGLNQTNTLAINNAVDVQTIISQAMEAAEARRFLKLPQQGLIFGSIGRCVKGKRHMELVRAFHQFLGEKRDVFLVIIGDGEARAELENYIAVHGLHEKIFLAGYIANAPRYLKALDVFVFPSESEGFGIALLEAMALGIPAIVNRVEPLASILGEEGIKVDSRDLTALATAMEFYVGLSGRERFDIGQAHYQRAQALYDIADYRRHYRHLVEQSLPSKCPGDGAKEF